MFKNFPSLPGIAIGIAIGILIAPDKGVRTRHSIAGKTKNAANEFSEIINDTELNIADIKNAFINELMQLTTGMRESLYGILGNIKALQEPEEAND